MAFKVADFVLETSTTTGTGSFTLDGAVSGYQVFSAFMSNGDTTLYSIKGGTQWEAGIGTWVTGGTLQRTLVTGSSNAGAAVNFSAGTKLVRCTPTAASASPGRHEVPLSAVSLRPTETDGATLYSAEATSNDIMQEGWQYGGNTNKHAQMSLVLPKQIDVAYGISFKFYWFPTAGSGTVIWGARSRAVSDGDTIDGAWGTGVEVTDTIQSTTVQHISSETSLMTVGNSWAISDKIFFDFYRNAASDTNNDPAVLTDIVMIVYANRGNDS